MVISDQDDALVEHQITQLTHNHPDYLLHPMSVIGVKILVPNSTAGMIIGKGGSYIKQIKEESGAYVQISQKSKDHALAERCITVIGEMDNNKKACAMILAKIVEDPQSGSCLNVSYADVTGPVANFNPTGSPYANTNSVHSGGPPTINNSTSYSSNGSLNSLSPTVTNNFGSPQGAGTPAGMLPFSGMSLGVGGPAIPPANAGQLIESIKAMLRGSGYSEQATAEIAGAMNTLASYGMLGLGLGLSGMFNSMNGTPMIGGLGMGIASTAANSCPIPPGSVSGQNMYTSATGVPGMDGSCNTVATSTPLAAGGTSLFGPIGSVSSSMSGLGLGPGFNSPSNTRSGERFPVHGEGAVFDPFRRTSPALGSPVTPALPVNNNSFGLGTGLGSGPPSLRKSPTPSERHETAKLEVEVGENIVGAILGPGGKSLVEIQRFSGATVQISKKGIFAPGTRNRIVTITGTPNAVSTAQYLIEQQIAEEEAKRAKQNAMGVLR